MSTRVYRYGLLPPTLEEPRIREQMQLAHTYSNKLVELERMRRKRISDVEADDAIRAIDMQIAATEESAKPLWEERRRLLKARRALPEVKAAVKAINDDQRGEVRAARKTCDVYWGTYLQVEAAMEAAASHPAPPKFRAWYGEGAVSVQLQQGMPVPAVLAGDDRRVALLTEPVPVPGRGGKPLPRLRLRVGSDGRDPIWAEWPIVYHRPLPLSGSLKWAKVVLRRISTREEWSVHFTIDEGERTETIPVPAARRQVAVELCAETDCAGRWTDGERSGRIELAPEIAGALRKAEDIAAIRERHLEELRAYLVPLRDAKYQPWPYKHRAESDRMPAWESAHRFHALAAWWRDHRYTGDEAVYGRLEAWRKRDKHLWLWQAHARLRAQRRRMAGFREFAAAMACVHSTIILPKVAAEPLDGGKRAHWGRLVAAPSELRGALVNAFAREGRQIIDVAAGSPAAMLACARAVKCSPRPQESARSVRFSRMHRIGDEIAKVATA